MYSAVGRLLLLAVKSLYSCSEVCVRIGRAKSRRFTVGIELRQRCVPGGNHRGHLRHLTPRKFQNSNFDICRNIQRIKIKFGVVII